MKRLLGLFALLASLSAVAGSKEYPYSVVPGGIPPDHALAHDQCLYLGMKFGGEFLWTDHCVWLKAGEKMAGSRRARCGNPTAAKLPPGAKVLTRGLRFLVPIMEQPVPDIVAPLQTTINELTWTPPGQQETLLPTERPVPPALFYIPSSLDSVPDCKHKPCKKPTAAPPQPTPEPGTLIITGTGLAGLVWLALRRDKRPAVC